MLGKAITLKKNGPTARGFFEAVRYVSRTGHEAQELEQDSVQSGEMGLVNLEGELESVEDLDALASAMNATALQSRRFKGNPVYHLAMSWQAGEHPSREQAEVAVHKMLSNLGMAECEALWAIHRDTDNDHVHLLVNRIHPEKGIVFGPPRFDWLIIDKACRELEIDQGWRHDNGPYVVLRASNEKIEIKRFSKAQRERLGVINEYGFTMDFDLDPKQAGQDLFRQSNAAGKISQQQGIPSFQIWIAKIPSRILQQQLAKDTVDWQKIHECLAEFGLRFRTKGSGLVVVGGYEGREVTAKASQMGRFASKGMLEKQLGAYHSASNQLKLKTDQDYESFVRNLQREDENLWDSRAVRREQRALEREALKARFEAEQKFIKEQRRQKRTERTARHAVERQDLRRLLSARRGAFIAARMSEGLNPGMARSLWALEAAKAREALAREQAAERSVSDGSKRSMGWRDWVCQEAERGDPAAESAWRGIRYREKRAGGRNRNGIEGKVKDLRLSIGLAELQAETDRRRGEILYKDALGRHLFTDTGPRIEMHSQEEEAIRLGLKLAAQKFGGSLEITGSGSFREKAAREAAQLGIRIRDEDLQMIWKKERGLSSFHGRSEEPSLER